MISPVVEKRINKLEMLADELETVCENGDWTDFAFSVLEKMYGIVLVLDDEHEDAEDVMKECIKSVREDSMKDAFEKALKDTWITTENNNRVHLNESGEADKGNPYVVAAINGAMEAGKKQARKHGMSCEKPVTFQDAGAVTTAKDGRRITRFNHDENEMNVTRQVRVQDEIGQSYKICREKIEHLTIFAASDMNRKVDVAEKLAKQLGGSAEGWKHVKGIGVIVGKDGKKRKADLHWFENPDVGQVNWKVKEFLEDMDESKIYWQE